jgi:hypothetical protein
MKAKTNTFFLPPTLSFPVAPTPVGSWLAVRKKVV